MTTGFQINGSDWDDLFVRKSTFTEGGIWSWGQNGSGQLGDGTIVHRSSPVQILSGGSNWSQVAKTQVGNASAAIKSDGTLWLWGTGTLGVIGDATSTNKSSPVQTVAGGTNWKFVELGDTFSVALKTDGTLWTWGRNSAGQLGDGTRTNRSSPVQTVAGSTNWKFVTCAGAAVSSIKTDGTLWVWGQNDFGQLGDGTIVHRSSPVQTISGGNIWKSVAGAGKSVLAIKTDGTLWTWGHNGYGTLGDNTVIHRSSPVQTIAGGTNWRFVSGGSYHAAAIKTDGTLWLWGDNPNGGLGINTTGSRSSPVQTISGGTNWKTVSLGLRFTAAIKTDGTLWTWGLNTGGQLGDGTRTNRSSPVQTITIGSNWKQVKAEVAALNAIREDTY